MVSLETPTPKVSSDYEKCREERIKENLERMQKLGIYDLSLKMKSIKPNRYQKKKNNNNKPPLPAHHNITPNPPLPATRRSSRLQSTPAVSYSEVDLPKKGKHGDDLAKNPEVYTEEHEKLLGEAKTEWTLFVDGYGKDGKRIYDQVSGKTCHQCRQKTLGYRTHCIKCNMVQGQFCGDCLYMRYGENVLEARQNPDWICPVCRGICNCSLCRQAKGWPPTGMLYRKISSQGYKSVAHYLIQTRRANPNLETTDTQVCAKPFSMEEANTVETIESKVKNFESEVNTDEKATEFQSSDNSIINNVKLESDQRLKEKTYEAEVVNGGGNEKSEQESDQGLKEKSTSEAEVENEKSELTNVENKVNKIDNEVNPVTVTRKKRCAIVIEGSIAGRLRSRRARV